MRQSSDRIVALSRALNKSVEQSKLDTQILLPPSVQSVIELPGNHKTFGNAVAGADQFDTFRRQDVINQAGINAGQAVNGPVLTAGLWHITGYVESHFTGTTNSGQTNNVGLNDVDNATGSLLIATHLYYNGTHMWLPIDLVTAVLFRAQLQVVTGTTVAADVTSLFVSLQFSKLI